MKSGDRLLSTLWLFSAERPILGAEAIADGLGISLSTAYRYVSKLCEAGLLAPAGSVGYGLGPAIIELDRQIRLSDPLVRSAQPVLVRVLEHVGPSATMLLCRLYRDHVMCVAQVAGHQALSHIAYERGRPMPLLRGAPSKAIMAQLPNRRAEQLWRAETLRAGDAPGDWPEVRAQLAAIRKAGVVISRGEIEPGVVGIAACVFDPQTRPIGAVCAVLPDDAATPPLLARVSILVRASADEISATLAERESAPATSERGQPERASRSATGAGRARRAAAAT